jgi:hypothetical protein
MKFRSRKFVLVFLVLLGMFAAIGTAAAASLSISTTFTGADVQHGIMFDVVAKSDITLENLSIVMTYGSDIEIWTRPGSFVGFESSPDGWTQLDIAWGVIPQPAGIPTPIPIDLSSITLSAGDVQALYINIVGAESAGPGFYMTEGSSVGSVFVSDDNIEILEGIGKLNSNFLYSVPSQPVVGGESRIFNGTINYTTPDPVIDNASIYYYAIDGGKVSVAEETIPVTGTPAGSVATADPGYEFIGWVGGAFGTEAELDDWLDWLEGLDDPLKAIISTQAHFVPPANDNGVWGDSIYIAVFVPVEADTLPPTGDIAPISMAVTALISALGIIGVGLKKRD